MLHYGATSENAETISHILEVSGANSFKNEVLTIQIQWREGMPMIRAMTLFPCYCRKYRLSKGAASIPPSLSAPLFIHSSGNESFLLHIALLNLQRMSPKTLGFEAL